MRWSATTLREAAALKSGSAGPKWAKKAPHHYSTSLKGWYHPGWIHAVMLFPPNPDQPSERCVWMEPHQTRHRPGLTCLGSTLGWSRFILWTAVILRTKNHFFKTFLIDKVKSKSLKNEYSFLSSDSIEDYIQNASSNVESANQELTKASEYQVELSTMIELLWLLECLHRQG